MNLNGPDKKLSSVAFRGYDASCSMRNRLASNISRVTQTAVSAEPCTRHHAVQRSKVNVKSHSFIQSPTPILLKATLPRPDVSRLSPSSRGLSEASSRCSRSRDPLARFRRPHLPELTKQNSSFLPRLLQRRRAE